MSVLTPMPEPTAGPAGDQPVTPLPPLAGLPAGRDAGRRLFRFVNRWLMLPVLRRGHGAWLGSPIGGWLLLLRVRGRKTGRLREVVLSYYVSEGSVWATAGFGSRSDWLRNLIVEPHVSVVLPGRPQIECEAQLIADLDTRRRIMPSHFRAVGLPGFLAGLNPWRATDADILAATAQTPLIRFRPLDEPVEASGDDPGGRSWIARQLAVAVVFAGLVAGAAWTLRRRR